MNTHTGNSCKSNVMHRLIILACLWMALAVLSAPVHAIVLVVDPGAVGSPAGTPLTSTALDPTITSNEVIVEFDLMKHVEATQWGFTMTPGFGDQDGVDIEWNFFLADENDNEIAGTRETGGGFVTGSFGIFRAPDPGIEAVIAHDIHFDFNWNPVTVSSANLMVFVSGQVGEWSSPVPVPATLWLFGSGLLGLAGISRRRVMDYKQVV